MFGQRNAHLRAIARSIGLSEGLAQRPAQWRPMLVNMIITGRGRFSPQRSTDVTGAPQAGQSFFLHSSFINSSTRLVYCAIIRRAYQLWTSPSARLRRGPVLPSPSIHSRIVWISHPHHLHPNAPGQTPPPPLPPPISIPGADGNPHPFRPAPDLTVCFKPITNREAGSVARPVAAALVPCCFFGIPLHPFIHPPPSPSPFPSSVPTSS